MIKQLNVHELTGLKNALGQFDVRRGGLSFTKWMIMGNHHESGVLSNTVTEQLIDRYFTRIDCSKEQFFKVYFS